MKRFLSAFISGIMILSLLPASAADNTETVQDVSNGVKAPVFNASNYNDDNLFKKYIRNAYSGKLSPTSLTLSSGALFKLVGRHNSAYRYSTGFNEKDDSMSMLWSTKYYRRNSGERWEANFKFKMATETSDQASYKNFKEMLESGQIQMKFGGNFANNGNSRPSMKFGSNGIDGSSLPNNATVEKDSGWFNVSYNDLMNTELKMGGGGDGSETYINRPWVMFADLTKPTIKSASIGAGTLKLDMGEPLRVIGNISDMKLKLRATNLQTGIQDIPLTATAERITYGHSNSIDFKIDAPDYLKEYQVTRIEGFEVSGQNYTGQMYGVSLADNYLFSTYYGEAKYKKINNQPGLIPENFTSSTPVTDIAGNNLEISRKDLTSFNLINDEVRPKVVSAEISGSMITEDNTKISQGSSWPEDIDRSSVFAGVGDSITFSLMSDEVLKTYNDSSYRTEIYIDLNIKDKDDKPIRLPYDKAEDVYDGVNKRKATKITFKPLTITADMKSDNINDPIRPTKIEVKKVWDLYGNPMDASTDIDFKPKQQIYFDNTAPTVKIDGNITVDADSGEFVVPIRLNDGEGTVSGFVGLDADFAWVYDGDKQISYKYAISTSLASPPAESDYKTAVLNNASTPAWNKFETPQSEFYIHIKTDAKELKDTKLMLKSNDWAGNSGTSEQSLDKISIDKVAPVISLVSMNTEYGDGSATIKAKVKVTDYNTDGLDAKYQLVDKDAQADENNWESANITDGVFDFSQVFNSSEKFEKDLLVYAADKKGNASGISRYSAVADLTKAKAKYEVKSDLSQLNSSPEITVSAPDNPDSKSNADTRVTLKMGENYYTKVYNSKNTESGVNIFDFSGQSGWYKVTYNQDGTAFESVTEVDDMTKLSGFYGEVTVEFESAFSDLTPFDSKALMPSEGEEQVSYQKEGGFKVLYAPVTADLHSIKFEENFKTDKGEALTAGGSVKHITRLKTMSDVRLSFSISNNVVAAWGVNNIDFEKSEIEVKNSNNDTVYTAPLSRSENQIFAMPDRDNNGNILGTDAYKITVYLYQTGNDKPQTFSYDTAVVLDNLTPSSNTGATRTEILPDRFFNYALNTEHVAPIEKTSDTPMTTINVGTADKAEIFRSETDAYSVNSFGMFYTKITLTTENVSKELCGETIGQVSGFRVWNKLTSGGEELPFKHDEKNLYSRTYDIRKIEDEAELKNAKADGDLKIVKGTNTICYQVKLDNGNISPIYEFTINTVDSLPQASLNMKINESKNYEVGSTVHALSADASLENVFSPNGDVKIYYLYQGRDSSSYTDWSCREINANDITNLIGELRKNYQSYTDVNDTGFKNTMHAFCIVDESGNSIVIFPQFKNGTKYTFENEVVEGSSYGLNSNNSSYAYQSTSTSNNYLDVYKSTIIINDSGEELPLKNPPIPNKYGYMGAYVDKNGKLFLNFTRPWDAEKANDESKYLAEKLTINKVGIHGDKLTDELSVAAGKLSGINYVAPEAKIWKDVDEGGTSICFTSAVKLKGEENYTEGYRDYPIFSNGTYNFEVTDVLGNTHTVPVTVNKWGDGPNVTVTPLEKTRGNVTLTAASDKYTISLAEKEGNSAATISDNNTNSVTADIKQPTELTMTWNDGSGEKSRTMIINNNEVKPISPKIVWDYSEGDITDGCVYESVTATLVDDNGSTLIDPITGGAPSHTFYPNGETEFTFKPQSYTNQYGDVAGEDITAKLAVKVIDYPAPKEWKDTTAPSVGIVGYVVRGDVAQSKNIILSVYNPEKQLANPALPEYTYNDSGTEKAYEKVESPEIFLQKMGWASKYRFNVNIGDESAVKLILKNGAPASAPDYNSVSDTIDGVSQSGRAIDVSKNASFTVYAIDSFGNTTSVYMNIDNVGNAPVPHLEKVVSGDSQKIKVYLVPPADGGLTELKITNGEPRQENENGDYKELYYIELSDNANDLVVRYSCKYNGEELTGQLSTSVTEIDKSNPKKIEEKWSENTHSIKTNKDVTVQMRFDKTVTDAKFKEAQTTAEIFKLDNQVTVSYSANSPALTLECTAVNGQKCEVKLNEVKNIDKTPPTITVTKTELSKYKRKATITLTADETVAFLEGGESGTEFTREVSANGEYTYNFTDLAGNKTEVTVKVSDIITGDLRLRFSLNSDGLNSQPTPDKLGGLKVGDKVYVKPSRDCKITFGQDITAKESEWTDLTVTEDKAGLYPTLKATDNYGNTKYYHFLQIALPDKTPPTIKLKAETIDISLSLSDNEIKSKLTENAIVSDDTSEKDKILLSFAYEKPKAAATVNVTYKAADEAGNTSQRMGKIHFYQNNELLVKVNDVSTYRDMVVISAKEPQNIVVSSGGEPYSVYVKNGIKTVGQMKIGSTKLAYNKTDDTAVVFTPDKAGYYTFLVKTQGQDSYRFVIYVK